MHRVVSARSQRSNPTDVVVCSVPNANTVPTRREVGERYPAVHLRLNGVPLQRVLQMYQFDRRRHAPPTVAVQRVYAKTDRRRVNMRGARRRTAGDAKGRNKQHTNTWQICSHVLNSSAKELERSATLACPSNAPVQRRRNAVRCNRLLGDTVGYLLCLPERIAQAGHATSSAPSIHDFLQLEHALLTRTS